MSVIAFRRPRGNTKEMRYGRRKTPVATPPPPRLEALEDRLLLARFTWIGAVDSSWSNPKNWDSDLPPAMKRAPALKDDEVDFIRRAVKKSRNVILDTKADIAIGSFDTDGAYRGTITLNRNLTVLNDFIMNSDDIEITGPKDLVFKKTATWLGGKMTGSGGGKTIVDSGARLRILGGRKAVNEVYLTVRRLVIQPTATMEISAATFYDEGTIENHGTVVVGRVGAMGFLDHRKNQDAGYFFNKSDGIVRFTQGGRFPIAVWFETEGDVDLRPGDGKGVVLSFQGGGGITTRFKGIVTLGGFTGPGGPGAQLIFSAPAGKSLDSYKYTWKADAGAGRTVYPFGVLPFGPVIVNHAKVVIDGDGPVYVPNLELTGGAIITGPGKLDVTRSFKWINGTMEGTGTTRYYNDARGAFAQFGDPKQRSAVVLDGRTFINDGPIKMAGPAGFSMQLKNGATFTNRAIFEIQGDNGVEGIGARRSSFVDSH